MSKRPFVETHITGSDTSRENVQRAIHALQMQRPDEAERIASDVVRADSTNLLALQVLGHALLIQNRAAEALVPLESAVGRSDDPSLETLYATALAGVGRRDDALARLHQTSARRPLYPPACLEYSAQLTKSGRFAEATQALQDALAIAPDVAELRIELGFHHLKRNERALARDLFAKVLTAWPDRPDALTALAKVMALDGDYADAVKAYRQLLARRPHDPMSLNNLAICLLELNDRAAGEARLRDVVRAVPQSAGQATTALASASHGRFFLRPSRAAAFLRAAVNG